MLNKTKTYLQGNQILLHTLLSIICAAVKLSISAIFGSPDEK